MFQDVEYKMNFGSDPIQPIKYLSGFRCLTMIPVHISHVPGKNVNASIFVMRHYVTEITKKTANR